MKKFKSNLCCMINPCLKCCVCNERICLIDIGILDKETCDKDVFRIQIYNPEGCSQLKNGMTDRRGGHWWVLSYE